MRSKEDVINIIRSYCLANDGDEATTDLLLAIGAEILGVSAEETQKMLAWSGREPDVPDQEGGHEQDRFTKRLSDGQAVMDCQKCEADWTAKHGKPLVQCTALYCRNRCKDRLADYEDAEDALKKYAETIPRKYHKQFNNSVSGFRAAGFYIKHLKIEKEKLKNGSKQEKN